MTIEITTDLKQMLENLSPMKTVYVKTVEESEKIQEEMKANRLHLASMSNAGLKEGFRLTFLPESAFKVKPE